MELKLANLRNGDVVEYYYTGFQGKKRIILWHGFPETPRSFFPLMEELAQHGWEVIAPYCYGYGSQINSKVANKKISLVELTEWNHSFIQSIGWDRFYLLGHDWGAIQVYSYCQTHPNHVLFYYALSVPPLSVFLKNLLLDPSQFIRSWYILFFQSGFSIPEKTLQNPEFIRLLWKTWSPSLEDSIHSEDVTKEIQELFSNPERVYRALSYYRGLFPSIQYWKRWNEARELAFKPILVPGCILAGELDGCISISMYKNYEKAVQKGTHLYILPKVGHFLPLEAPNEILQIILETSK